MSVADRPDPYERIAELDFEVSDLRARLAAAEAALSEARAALEAIKSRAARLVELNCDHKWGDVYFGIKTPEPDEVLVNYMWRCDYCGSIKLDHGVTIIRGDLEALPQNIYAKADDALRALPPS